MQEYPSTEIKHNWGKISDAALIEPVTLTKHGRASHVVMSNEEYLSLKKAAFVAEVKAKLEEGKRDIENGDFSTMTAEDIKAEGRKRLEGNG